MKMIDRNVDASMPPATAVPTELRDAAPAPVANASGNTPRMNANDVIRIGRRRMRADSIAASTIDRPALAQLLGELDDQDRVLRREADQQHQPDLAEHVVVEAAQQLRGQRAEHRQRHAEQDDQRQDERLVLRRQHQVDEQQAEAEDQAGLAARPPLLERLPRPREVEAGRQVRARQLLHRLAASGPSSAPAPGCR